MPNADTRDGGSFVSHWLRALSSRRIRKYRRQIQETGLRALIAALDARDSYTGRHSEAVVDLAYSVASNMGVPDAVVSQVRHVGLLHDVGKIGIPDSILLKPGPLDEREWNVMRQHPVIGEKIVASISTLAHLAKLIRAEHERWDGGGYPDGLRSREIPLASRVIFACDAFHAMISDRPYRRAMSADVALQEMLSNSRKQFCPDTIRALVETIEPTRQPPAHATFNLGFL